MNFSEKLYYLRNSENMSQEELANKFGVSRQAVSKWELGDSTPELSKIIEMSEYFHVSVDSLVKDSQQLEQSGSLERMVIDFINSSRDMNRITNSLIKIAKDGIIDEEEKKQLKDILTTLDSIAEIIAELRKRITME